MASDVWHLLRRNLSRWQLFGFSVANTVGVTVILVGILFYCDSQQDNSHNDQYFSNDYIVLSKEVEGIGFTPITFSEQEISDLQNQPWVRKIGRFTASQFAVNGAVSMGGKGLSTYLFFESVPDEFFDIKPRDWQFKPGDTFVPVILSKDYLTLYNFGFAVPQGLPQISEEIIGTIPITLRLTGRGMNTEHFDAAIVGFSSRLNTIAVPQSFMDWANKRYSGDSEQQNPSRLILEIDRMAATSMDEYLHKHGMEVAGDKAEAGKISTFLGAVSAVVATGGIVICLLAMFILILSIFLLLQKSKTTLRNLMLLGYHPMHVARYYELMVLALNVAITLLSLAITFALRPLWIDSLLNIGLGNASTIPMLLFSLVYMLGVTAIDVIVIRSRLLSIWRNK